MRVGVVGIACNAGAWDREQGSCLGPGAPALPAAGKTADAVSVQCLSPGLGLSAWSLGAVPAYSNNFPKSISLCIRINKKDLWGTNNHQ